jgi:Fe-S-cluster containining protein
VSRINLPVLGEERAVACTECGRCCTYVGIGINPPTSARHATDVLWYLYHEGVYVYVDGEGEWSVHFEARCRNLGDDLLCRIYVDRPHICRGFDSRSCEVNDQDHRSLTFREPAQFLAWLLQKRPRLHEKLEHGFVPKSLRAGRTGSGQRGSLRRVARAARAASERRKRGVSDEQ